MRKIILIVLPLIISILEINGANFGDIYSFQRKCCGKTYKHYAIYVGDKKFYSKNDGDNIFHRYGLTRSGCVFGNLQKTGKHNLDNYLDGLLDKFPQFKVGTPEQITARINEKSKSCGFYGPRVNNCEHLATYVRYGLSVSLQTGQDVAKHCKNDHIATDLLEEIRKALKEAETECTSCSLKTGKNSA